MQKFLSVAALPLILTLASFNLNASPWTITKGELKEKYDYVDPQQVIPEQAKNYALAYFEKNKSSIPNVNYLTVIDYTQKSIARRLFVIDMRTGEVESELVAHGSGSDSNNDGYATVFSNVPNSKATSLGFALTAETYQGKHGRSLRLDGVSRTNSNMRRRAVVMHSADYVKNGHVGRSEGCQAVNAGVKDKLIDKLEEGSVIYSYHASFSDGQ